MKRGAPDLPCVHDFCQPPEKQEVSDLTARLTLRRLRGQPFLTARETLMLLDWPELDDQVGLEGPLRNALNDARGQMTRARHWLPTRPDLNAVNLTPLHATLLGNHPLTDATEFAAVGSVALLAAVAAEARSRALNGEAVTPHHHPSHDFTALMPPAAPEATQPTGLARRRWTWTQLAPTQLNLEESTTKHRTASLASAGPARQTSAATARSPSRRRIGWPRLWQGGSQGHTSGLQGRPVMVTLSSRSHPVCTWARRIPAPDDLTEEQLRALLRETGLRDEVTGLVAGLMVGHVCLSALKRPPTTERDWGDQMVLRASLPASNAALFTDLYLPWPRPGTGGAALWAARPPSLWSGRPLRRNGLVKVLGSLDAQLARTPVARAADRTLQAGGLLTALLPLSRAQTQALLWLRNQVIPGDTAQLMRALLTALDSAPPPPLRWRVTAERLRRDLRAALRAHGSDTSPAEQRRP